MKRTFSFKLWLALLFCLANNIQAQNIQQKRWVLNNQSIDFTVDPPVVVSGLPQFPGFGRKVVSLLA